MIISFEQQSVPFYPRPSGSFLPLETAHVLTMDALIKTTNLLMRTADTNVRFAKYNIMEL